MFSASDDPPPAPAAGGWDEVAPGFADAVRRYHVARGRSADDPAVLRTIRTNSDLVPQRAANVLGLLERLAGRSSLRDLRVLEAGAGFGGLAAYLASQAGPRETVGIDIRPEFVASARAGAAPLGLAERLRFVQGDMRSLSEAGLGAFDVAIANNALVYLATAGDMQQALRELFRVLTPGGHVIFFQANRWIWRDPFTRAPLVHLLPRSLAERTPWPHSHGRVRLVSIPELRLRALAAGFREIRSGAFAAGGRFTRRAEFQRYFGLAGRRPPG